MSSDECVKKSEDKTYVGRNDEGYDSDSSFSDDDPTQKIVSLFTDKLKIVFPYGPNDPRKFFLVTCEHCNKIHKVYHLFFCAARCDNCNETYDNPAHKDFHVDNRCYFGDFSQND